MSDDSLTPPMQVTVVHADACHFCDDALSVLADLSATWPVVVRVVELQTPEGESLVAQHRPAMNPLVLVDGRYFSAGRLPRKKLTKMLIARYTSSTAAQPLPTGA